MNSLMRAENITKVYGAGETQVTALKGISLKIREGEFVSIMGPSGSGKTTLMDILGCLSKSTAGTYLINNRRVNELDDNALSEIRNSSIGFVFQDFSLLQRMTVLENVMLPMFYAGIEERERKERAVNALESVGLQHRMDHFPNEISGGEKQRTAIARALVNDPPIILADEPTGNLDSASGKGIIKILHILHSQGKTIVMVTHDREIASNAGRIVFMRDGYIVDEKFQQKLQTKKDTTDKGSFKRRTLYGRFVAGIVSGFRGLLANKIRAFLTLLGVVIGVASVVGMLGVGEGTKRKISSELERLGTNNFTVFYRRPRRKSQAREWRGRSEGLTYEDAVAINKYCSGVEMAAPIGVLNDTVQYQDNTCDSQVIGTVPSYQEIANHWVKNGRFFRKEDLNSWAKVCAIGTTVKSELFGANNPIGREIKIRKKRFVVIGVMEEKGAMFRYNYDEQIFIPITTFQKRLTGNDTISAILAKARSFDIVLKAEQEVNKLLLNRHNNIVNFRVRGFSEMQNTLEQTVNTFKTMMASIAAISLIVGGIGIMNIMLVSITERTREIGIRKAVGAKKKDILVQFLIESTVLSVTGGIIGIILGIIFAATVGNLLVGAGMFGPHFLRGGISHSVITMKSILLAFLFSLTVGIFFGIYPARRASKLDPVEALRYE